MDNNHILQQFQEKVSKKITIKQKGVNRYTVKTPFMFEDGDNLVIILKYDPEGKNWFLTDEGHTFLHISYFMDEKDFSSGTRRKIIDNCKGMFSVTEEKGELRSEIVDDRFGDYLYDFVQCLLKISDITFLDRERVKSTFNESFKSSMDTLAKKKRIKAEFNYHIKEDTSGKYEVDCFMEVRGKKIFVWAINGDEKCRDATIAILSLEKKNVKFHAVGIFENQEEIARKVLARFSDACEKQVPSLDSLDRFEKYIED